MEVTPPQAVWEKLSLNIDEINEDNRIAQRVLNAELAPPSGIWEKINSTINVVEEIPVQKKGTVINFRRLAAAAVFIGIIATAWILLRNNNKPTELAGTEKSTQKKSTDTNNTKENKDPNIDSPINQPDLTQTNIPEDRAIPSDNKILASTNALPQQRNKNRSFSGRRSDFTAEPATAEFASLNEPLAKSSNEPIDDLSSVTSDQNYYTMVNANGRLVKIPTQLASLAPHLQDKPIAEDYHEVLFGEGAYWKETLSEWRKKLVSTPTGDAFSSFVELLKTVQDK
jgi:hypothetical protein